MCATEIGYMLYSRAGSRAEAEFLRDVADGVYELVQVTAADAKFPNQWFDNQSEVIASRYIITHKHPDLMLIHLGDLAVGKAQILDITEGAVKVRVHRALQLLRANYLKMNG